MNLLSLARSTVPIVVIFALLDTYFLGKSYIFSPERMQQISRASIAKYGNDTELLIKDIHASLQLEYGDAILPYENKWVLNNAGGAMVAQPLLCVLLMEPTGGNDDFTCFNYRVLDFLWNASCYRGTYGCSSC